MTISHYEVAKAFARGEREASGSNMFIDNGIIYSYGFHFPICKRMPGYYIFNDDDYSVSTAKHKNYVMRVISGIIINITKCKVENAEEQIKINNQAIKGYLDKCQRARTKMQYYLSEIRYLLKQNYLIEYHILNQKDVQEYSVFDSMDDEQMKAALIAKLV